MEDNKMMKLTKRQRQALSSPAAKGKGKSSVTLPGAEFLSKKKQPMKVGRQSQIVKYEEKETNINEKTEYVEYEFKNRGDKKILTIKYTPDFIGHDYIIECKGRANESFPIRWKMFKKYVAENLSNVTLYKPQNQKECEKVVEIILKKRK